MSSGTPAGRRRAIDARRAADIVVAATALVLTSPLLAAVAVAVRVTMGGRVLFTQARSGLDGTEFTIYKFRTMRDARYDGEPDNDRTPRLGRVLRATSLDELPQFVNVIKGEMSLIGPRPTLPEQVAHYSPRQRQRLRVRPGMTGYAQVKGRNALSWPERIELDLEYLERRSLRLDLWIVAMTVRRLLRPRGITGSGGVNHGFPAPAAADQPAGSSDRGGRSEHPARPDEGGQAAPADPVGHDHEPVLRPSRSRPAPARDDRSQA